jgi:hypothetical protein
MIGRQLKIPACFRKECGRRLLLQRIILNTHSLKYFEVRRLEHPPYRILAVTPALEAG